MRPEVSTDTSLAMGDTTASLGEEMVVVVELVGVNSAVTLGSSFLLPAAAGSCGGTPTEVSTVRVGFFEPSLMGAAIMGLIMIAVTLGSHLLYYVASIESEELVEGRPRGSQFEKSRQDSFDYG